MADQDLELHVKSFADLMAIKEAEIEVRKLGEAEAETAAQMEARQASLRGALTPVPEALQKGAGAFAGLSGGYEGLTSIAADLERARIPAKELNEASTFLGANLTRARQEAIILARELATGVPTVRTLSSLLGSLGIPIAIAATAGIALYKAFESSAEAAKKLRAEQEKLNEELDRHLGAAEKITTVEDWDKANDAIEEQIKLLERRLYLATDRKERESIFTQLQYAEQEKRLLPDIVAKGLQRAEVERAIADDIRLQVDAVNEVSRAYDRARSISDQNFKAAKELRNIQRESQSDIVKEKADTGQIDAVEVLTEQEELRAKQSAENNEAAKRQIDERLAANAKEFTEFDAQSKEAHKILEERRRALEYIQYLKTLPTRALEPDEAEAVKNLKSYSDALKEQEKITEAIDENRRKAIIASDTELPKLLQEKAILDQIYQAEEARNKAIFERAKQSALGEEIKGASAQTKAVLANELAAERARKAGDERSADLYAKSAEQFEKSMTGPQRAELEKLRAETKEPPVGRTAGVGESQEAVDRMERNRINFERQLSGQKPIEEKGRDDALIKAVEALGQKMDNLWR